MSSDRWSTCPKCQEVADHKQKRTQEDIAEARRARNFTLFETLLTQSIQPVQLQETLQQDWEIGIVNTGWKGFEVYFEASCRVCGFKYSFRVKDPDLSGTLEFTRWDGEKRTYQL